MYKKSLSLIPVFAWDITANMFSGTKGKQYLYAQSFFTLRSSLNACSYQLLGCPMFSRHHYLYHHVITFIIVTLSIQCRNEPVFLSTAIVTLLSTHLHILAQFADSVPLKLISDCLFISEMVLTI